MIRHLVEEKKANVNVAESRNSVIPLHWASREGHLEAVSYLLEKGALINAQVILSLDKWSVFFVFPSNHNTFAARRIRTDTPLLITPL